MLASEQIQASAYITVKVIIGLSIMSDDLTSIEIEFIENASIIVGIDEAGAGTLAGDLVVAGCILSKEHGIKGLDDSKKLSEKKREMLFDLIKDQALAFHIEHITPEDVDKSNIFACRMDGMRRCAEALAEASHVIVDGDKIPHKMPKPTLAIIKADDKIDCVRAASILAKVSHDRKMVLDGAAFPDFQFEKHKGYGTQLHKEMLDKHGPTPLHRMSYKPVMEAAKKHNTRIDIPTLKNTHDNSQAAAVNSQDDDFGFRF